MMTQPKTPAIANRHQSSTRIKQLTVLLVIALAFVLLNESMQPSVDAAAITSTLTPDLPNQLATAERQTDEALSLYWAAQAQLLYEHGDVPTALALAIEANRIPNPPSQSVKTLEDLAYAPGPRKRISSSKFDLGLSADISFDGKLIASGTINGTVAISNLETGEKIHDLCCHRWAIVDVKFSPDGTKLISHGVASYGDVSGPPELAVWDVITGNRLWPPEEVLWGGYTMNFDSPIFSPDSKTIVTNDGHDHLIEWDANNGEVVRRYSGKAADKLSGNVAFSSDGSKLTSGTMAGDVIVWDARTTHQITRFSYPYYRVNYVSFTPDGRAILVANENGIITMWDVNTGELQLSFWMNKRTDRVTNVFFVADREYFYTTTLDGDLIFWDVGSQQAVTIIHTRGTTLSMTPDRQHFLVQTRNNSLELWDVKQGQEMRRYMGHSGMVNDMAISPDGQHVVSAGSNGELFLWDTNTEAIVLSFEGHDKNYDVEGVAISPDGNTLASVSAEGSIFLWEIQTGKVLQKIRSPFYTNVYQPQLVFSPDGHSLLTAGDNSTLIQWDVSSGQETSRFGDKQSSYFGLSSAVYSPNGLNILSIDTRLNVILWDVVTRKAIRHLPNSPYAAFTPDGRSIVSEGEDGELVFIDVITGEEVSHINRGLSLKDVSFSADGQRFLTSSWDGLIVWDVKTGEIIRHFYVVGYPAVFSPDGRFILTKSDDIYYSSGFFAAPGRDLILLRVDTLDELIQWTLANRVVATLTCGQRQLYNVTPLCINGTSPTLTPYQTWTPRPTATFTTTPNLTRTKPTATSSTTPTIPTSTLMTAETTLGTMG